jgi:hypothetical protein
MNVFQEQSLALCSGQPIVGGQPRGESSKTNSAMEPTTTRQSHQKYGTDIGLASTFFLDPLRCRQRRAWAHSKVASSGSSSTNVRPHRQTFGETAVDAVQIGMDQSASPAAAFLEGSLFGFRIELVQFATGWRNPVIKRGQPRNGSGTLHQRHHSRSWYVSYPREG